MRIVVTFSLDETFDINLPPIETYNIQSKHSSNMGRVGGDLPFLAFQVGPPPSLVLISKIMVLSVHAPPHVLEGSSG